MRFELDLTKLTPRDIKATPMMTQTKVRREEAGAPAGVEVAVGVVHAGMAIGGVEVEVEAEAIDGHGATAGAEVEIVVGDRSAMTWSSQPYSITITCRCPHTEHRLASLTFKYVHLEQFQPLSATFSGAPHASQTPTLLSFTNVHCQHAHLCLRLPPTPFCSLESAQDLSSSISSWSTPWSTLTHPLFSIARRNAARRTRYRRSICEPLPC